MSSTHTPIAPARVMAAPWDSPWDPAWDPTDRVESRDGTGPQYVEGGVRPRPRSPDCRTRDDGACSMRFDPPTPLVAAALAVVAATSGAACSDGDIASQRDASSPALEPWAHPAEDDGNDDYRGVDEAATAEESVQWSAPAEAGPPMRLAGHEARRRDVLERHVARRRQRHGEAAVSSNPMTTTVAPPRRPDPDVAPRADGTESGAVDARGSAPGLDGSRSMR